MPEVEDFSTNFDGKKPEKDGSGAKLDSKTQQKMESGFGTDFKEVSPRYGAVADMLLSLRNNCWDFEKTAAMHCASMLDLTSDSDGFRWDPKSPELIQFNDWFENRAGELLV